MRTSTCRSGCAAAQIPTDHGDALAEYRAHLELGVDAFVTDYPDTAALARSERDRPRGHGLVQPSPLENGVAEEGRH